MAETVLRQEQKYLLDTLQAPTLYAHLSTFLPPDPHSRNGSYMVRSVYFDTPDDRDFFDKCTEQNLRRKIRLRIYHPDAPFAKLELKQKENIYQKKRSLRLSRQQAQAVIRGNYSVLLELSDPFAMELFSLLNTECYRPKTVVEYRRSAFLRPENNTRITFDQNICACESSVDLFSPCLPLSPVMDPRNTILEVKFNRFLLSYIGDLLSLANKRSISASKYCMARNLGYPLQL